MLGPRRTYGGPVTIFVIVLFLIVTLTVLWNVALVHDYQRIRDLARAAEREGGGAFHWTFLALGSALFVTIIILTSIFGARLFSEIRWNRLQDNLLASVSHELNTPLQAIKLHVQTLTRAGVGEPDRARFLGVILEEVERLRALIDNILRAAQIDQRRLPLVLEKIPIADYLSNYVNRWKASFERTGDSENRIEFEADVEAWVEADRMLLVQMFDNVLSNSLKYAREGGARTRIALSGPRNGKMIVSFSDAGIGIPKGELRRVFDRFYRVETSDPARARKGTGLGLAIVRSIAEAHGWSVSASSAGSGTGTTIEFEIPRFELAGSAPKDESSSRDPL